MSQRSTCCNGKCCAPGLVCMNGVCQCPAGQSNCSGACADTQTDVRNCSSLRCMPAPAPDLRRRHLCVPRQPRLQSLLLPGRRGLLQRDLLSPLLASGGTVIYPLNDPQHCGSCDHICPAYAPLCDQGQCYCPGNWSVCSLGPTDTGYCTDLRDRQLNAVSASRDARGDLLSGGLLAPTPPGSFDSTISKSPLLIVALPNG